MQPMTTRTLLGVLAFLTAALGQRDCLAAGPPIVCGTGTSGMLGTSTPVIVPPGSAEDLAGAAIAAEARTTIPSSVLTIACAPDIVPPGYVALGPAVSFGPEGTASDRPFLLTLPYKAARLPAGAGRRHVRVVAQRASGSGAVPFFPAVANLTLDDADPLASRATFRDEELTTFQVVARADAGQPVVRHFLYRAVAGVSMGGAGATTVGFLPGRFDVIGTLGGDPGSDTAYFTSYARDFLYGGFSAGRRAAFADQFEIACDFEHQTSQQGEGVGLTLRRSLYVRLSRDMARAFGNPASYNPGNPYLPPGVPDSWLLLPAADRCATPLVLTGVYDRAFNPGGSLPVVTVCDGGDSSTLGLGVFDPSLPQDDPYELLLAVDTNGNGKRDAGEPVLVHTSEPFVDSGVDGVSDPDEPGYDPLTNPDPNGDDYHFLKNPNGTEGDQRWEPGEPFEDVGLDGVAGTCQLPAAGCYDFGEGDGTFTVNPNIAQYWSQNDAARALDAMTPAERDAVSIWADAGIRDFLNAHVADNRMTAHMAALGLPLAVFDGFPALQSIDRHDLPRNVYVRYGDPDLTEAQVEATGDGRHVGSVSQSIARIVSLFAWIDTQWPNGDRTLESGSPTIIDDQFTSPATGRNTPFAVVLPPGYDAHPTLRYPVVYFLHGYGQQPADVAPNIGPIVASGMSDPDDQKRLQKMILVFADGACRPLGTGVPTDPTGDGCEEGTFYTDSPVNARAQMRTHLLELMDLIDQTYRTKSAEDVQVAGDGCSGDCPPALDHFKCYAAKTKKGTPKFTGREVSLADQYETKDTDVLTPDSVCNPVSKDGEAVNDPTAHLLCYRIKDVKGQPKFAGRDAMVANQFGTEDVSVQKAATLCVPSTADGVPSALNLDHFKCYQAKTRKGTAKFEGQDVTLADQFESKETLVGTPETFCTPAAKDGEAIRSPAARLRCYKIKDAKHQAKFAGQDVAVANQLDEETVAASKAKFLCVPSSETTGSTTTTSTSSTTTTT
jgi:hypothetical protein